MSMLINTISAIGNNTSFCPLLVRDCCIEAPVKIAQTYNQNAKESKIMAKHATRERIIDEYGTSAVWLGGIPLVEKLCNKYIDKKGLSSKVSYKLLEESSKNASEKLAQGLDINIKKFENNKSLDVVSAVNDLKSIKSNKTLFKNLTALKYTLAILIPISIMGFVLPKSNFALTRYLIDKDAKKGLIPEKYLQNTNNKSREDMTPSTDTNIKDDSSQNNTGKVSFKGFSSFMTGLTQQQKMAITDGGLGIGRISTSRKKNEAIENAIKASGMLYLSFVAPKQIDKGLDKVINNVFGINPSLAPKIMANKRFLALARSNELELPKTQEEVIDFIDKNPKSAFTKIAEEQGEIKLLKSGVRDPRYFVSTKNVFELATKMDNFAKTARNSGNIAKYAKKAIFAKSTSILANIAISSTLLAVGLPQLLFAVRKVFFKSDVDPGLA